jgi:hypothetical protein
MEKLLRASTCKTLTTGKAETFRPKLLGIAWLAVQVALACRYAEGQGCGVVNSF